MAQKKDSKNPFPKTTVYEKPTAPKKVADKTGWVVRPENKEIFGSKK
jgi:hypothetical protein